MVKYIINKKWRRSEDSSCARVVVTVVSLSDGIVYGFRQSSLFLEVYFNVTGIR